MRRLIAMLALSLIAAGPAAKPIAPGTLVAWTQDDGVRSWTSGGVTATLSARGSGDEGTPALTVSAPGMKPLVIADGEGMARYASQVGIGPLTSGGKPGVLLETYSGGAHCCVDVVAVVAQDGVWRKVDLGSWDGDAVDWPKDISGDGVADFVFVDNAFLYAFASYADSMAPPLVMNIRGLKPVDVSTDPAFRKLYEADLASTRKVCLDRSNDYNNGACAAYAADAARLGKLSGAWPEILRSYNRAGTGWPDGCRVAAGNAGCPKPAVIHYRTYPEALTAFLKANGYSR
ncbi:hypothetical protein [uncultured Sphingomonas sp.]|uniref:hypothetical protein n=1 Tax=uncultured Sphingomonas sp. TaxID=158754 RepID=UPI0035CC4DB7